MKKSTVSHWLKALTHGVPLPDQREQQLAELAEIVETLWSIDGPPVRALHVIRKTGSEGR